MRAVWLNLRGALRRVFPHCVTQGQAVAFNMFLSFFPLLLFALGVLGVLGRSGAATHEMLRVLRLVLPPGSERMVAAYLVQHGGQPWKWILLGLGGTFLGGTQVMLDLMRGFRVAAGEPSPVGFWRQRGRALALLSAIFVPWLVTVLLTVFAKQVRTWLIQQYGLAGIIRAIWAVTYSGLVVLMAMFILVLVYRVGRPGTRSWNEVVPGAVLATLLWWLVNSALGFYVRHMPYGLVYGGLAAAIGLMLWMFLSTLVVFLGAAFNLEACRAAPGANTAPREG